MENILLIPIVILFLVSLISLFCKMGIKKSKEIQIEPPNNMNPLELSYIYKSKVNTSDVISLIPYLIDKGNIKVDFPFQEGIKQDIDFKLIKNKEYTGDNALEAYIFNGIFEKSDIVTYKELCSDIQYKALFNNATNVVNTDKNYNIIFKKSIKTIRKMINLCIVISLFIFDCMFNMELINLFFYFIQIALLIAITVSLDGQDTGISINKGPVKLKRNNLLITIILTVVLLLFSMAFLGTKDQYSKHIIMKSTKESIIYMTGIIIFAVISILKKYIYKRNKYGEELYLKVKNFRDFLNVTPKESIEAEFNKNRDCYFDIFSYCFALEMSSKCITEYDKFFNNAWNMLYTVTNIQKNTNRNNLQSMNEMQEYIIKLKTEKEKFENMLEMKQYYFLERKLLATDINLKVDDEFNVKYIFKAFKNWIMNS